MSNNLSYTIRPFVNMINGEWSTLSLDYIVGESSDRCPAKVFTAYARWLDEEQVCDLIEPFGDSACGLSAEGWIDESGNRRVNVSVLTEWPEK